MLDDQARDLGARFQAAVAELERSGELPALVSLYSSDGYATNHNRQVPSRGPDSVRAFWDSYRRTFGSVSSTFGPVMVGDGSIALEWSTTGDLAGSEITYCGVTVLSYAPNGTIESSVAYFDPASLRQAIATPRRGDAGGGGVDARPAEEHGGWRTDPEEDG